MVLMSVREMRTASMTVLSGMAKMDCSTSTISAWIIAIVRGSLMMI